MCSLGSRFQTLIAATGGALLLAGCGSGHDASSHAPSPSTSAKPSASASAPVSAADGTDLKACADGKCEVRVGPSARIPVPRRLEVASVRVQSVRATEVTIVGRYTGNRTGGSGSGNFSADSSNGKFRLTIGLNSEATENGLDVAVLALQGGYAVLRISSL